MRQEFPGMGRTKDEVEAGVGERGEQTRVRVEGVPLVERRALVAHGRLQVEPVSYTHLRAHETVLDLVCRLLLEKKNN